MAATLRDGDFDLNGYVIGGDKSRPVYVVGLDTGVADPRTEDSDEPYGDARVFGQDRLKPPTWTFEFRIGERSAAAALPVLEQIAHAWRSAPRGPGEESVLRYMVGGRVRRIYGRPRRFSSDPRLLFSHGRVVAAGQFDATDAVHYDDQERSLTVSLVPGSTGGLVSPLISPLTTVAGGKRQGIVQVEGTAPAPLLVTFKGPISNPGAASTGWSLQLLTTLAHDQSVTVDTRRGTVLRNDGASLAGALTRDTFLSDVRLMPGSREIVFTGNDPTATATCTVVWRSTYDGL